MTGVVDVASVQDEGEREALAYKWIVSQQANRDMGDSAINQWVKVHWQGFLRARWFEHIQGARYWQEFDSTAYGLLNREFNDRLLLELILDRLRTGQENLDVIQWAIGWKPPMASVLEILEILDINSCRISCRFFSGGSKK